MADKRASRTAAEILPKSVRDEIDRAIEPHLSRRTTGRLGGHQICSAKMRDDRRAFAHRMVADLWELGYKIRKPESLSAKHVQALMTYWHEKGIVAGTLHTRLSHMNVMCGWFGKRHVVQNIKHYLPAEVVKRETAVKESKAWEDHGVDPLVIIAEARKLDERFAVMLSLQHHFGLRVKESIELKPSQAIADGGTILELHEGTKGGKLRHVRIRTKEQRETLEWARRLAATGRSKRVRWPDRTWDQAQGRFYYLMQKLGLTLAEMGVTAHGLRHGFSHRDYEYHTDGMLPPVKGGSLGKIDRETHFKATMSISRALGHGRPDVVPSYCGSYGHQLRMAPATKITFNIDPEVHAPAKERAAQDKKLAFV